MIPKKIKSGMLIVAMAFATHIALSTSAQAQQFGDYGVRAGLGVATYTDDLATKAPVLGATLGGFINFDFEAAESPAGELFYLQTGLNLNRRGSVFQEVFEKESNLSIREGYMHAYYAQIPILACLHMELPIREAGHVVGVFAGPAVSVGLFGRYADRKVSPGVATYTDNYDIDVNGTSADRAVFNHIKRLDISAVFGITYERGPLMLSLYVDHGFIATSKGEDILRIIENGQAQILDQINNTDTKPIEVEIPNGNNTAWMLSASYKLGSLPRK